MTDARELLTKFKNGTCTKEELQLIKKWALNHRAGEVSGLTENDFEQAGIDIWEKIQEQRVNSVNRVQLWPRIAAAAAVVICFCVAGYFLSQKAPAPAIVKNQVHQPASHKQIAILPGGNKAVLTLANGKTIVLTGAQNGNLATQGNISITKAADGQIIYNVKPQNNALTSTNEITYNTVSTPRGGQYQIILPDGSHVWLNAASSIKYPTSFMGKSREVELTGEAYFEIAKNPEKPFRVHVIDKQDIEVLGTHFNVEAYDDDSRIKTTLLEGSVKLFYGHKQAILVPGQIAVNNLAESLTIKKANIEEVMAWKNGYFMFNDESIKDVMKKAARWYDFDVEYRGNVQKKKFGGIISRYKSITELLDNMKISGSINYQIEGRRIILTD